MCHPCMDVTPFWPLPLCHPPCTAAAKYLACLSKYLVWVRWDTKKGLVHMEFLQKHVARFECSVCWGGAVFSGLDAYVVHHSGVGLWLMTDDSQTDMTQQGHPGWRPRGPPNAMNSRTNLQTRSQVTTARAYLGDDELEVVQCLTRVGAHIDGRGDGLGLQIHDVHLHCHTWRYKTETYSALSQQCGKGRGNFSVVRNPDGQRGFATANEGKSHRSSLSFFVHNQKKTTR